MSFNLLFDGQCLKTNMLYGDDDCISGYYICLKLYFYLLLNK
jgi:hypothetical protein